MGAGLRLRGAASRFVARLDENGFPFYPLMRKYSDNN
jgi:hypothetical protein